MNPEKPKSGAGQPASILVVDDAPANLQVLAGMLKNCGYKVRPVPSGKMALLTARIGPPDLILLDINMPEMNGYEVCEHLKADDRLAGIPVIFISALTEQMDKVKAFAIGGVDYVTKPFQMEELHARVETHLKLRRQQIEVKKAASEREHLNERLAHRNQELQALLQHAQRVTPLGTMAAGLAHEICNPLTVLRLSLFSIRASLGQGGGEGGALPARDELDKDLRMIGDEIDRLEQLARKYLDYSRLGEQHLHAEPIGAILASAVSLIAHRIRETGVAVTVQVEPNLPLVRVDAGQIKQVLLNLLGNALDVLPSGGTILLSARPGTGPEGKGQVVVEVRDNGPGIPNEVVGQVFVAFFSTKVGGTGLGLPISAQLAQQNGGRLVLESTSVGGTCFALWLPSTQTDE